MEKINEKVEWSDVVLLENGVALTGGKDGNANRQALALANRTFWLKENMVEEINGKNIIDKKVEIRAEDICTQSGETVQAKLESKAEKDHGHGTLKVKSEDAGKFLMVNSEGTQTEWQVVSGNPVGTIIAWAGFTPPAGYLECAGQILKRDIYKDLFQAIGTIWGTAATDNFKLPDFTSAARFLRSRGDGLEVGMTQEDAILKHYHDLRQKAGASNFDISGPDAIGFGNLTGVLAGTTDYYGDSETRPKNAVVMYCIKAVDEYINPAQVDMAKVAEENAKKAYREDVKELAGTRLWISDPILHINETAFIAKHNLPIRNWKEAKCDFLLVCKVPEHGYSSGWSAQNVFVHHTNSFTPMPWIGGINNGEIYLKKGAGNAIYTMRATDGAQVACNWNNWEVYFRIWY